MTGKPFNEDRKRTLAWVAGAAALATLLAVGETAYAQHDHGDHGHGHGAPTAPAKAKAGGGHDEHAGEHGEHHRPPFNFMFGLFVESSDPKAEPTLFVRPKGMPVPFLATLINFAVLIGLAFKFAAKPISEGLVARKESLTKEIDEAAKIKAEAAARLKEYKTKLEKLDQEVERIKGDYSEQGEREKERIVREAKERRERMKRDAEFLIEQEAKELKSEMLRKTIEQATASAEAMLRKGVSSQDQERLAQDYLKEIGGLRITKGGVA